MSIATNTNGRHHLSSPIMHRLEHTLADLERRFGENTIMRLGQAGHLQTQAISTGISTLDQALGIGGLPRGRIVDIFGPESSGKTTLCLKTIAQALAPSSESGEGWEGDPFAVYIDLEHALDLTYALQLGVDPNRLYLAQPHTGEQALEIAEVVIRAGVAVVVIDSTAALLPRAEQKGEIGDNHAGLQTSLMSQALRKLAGPIRDHNSLVIFISQMRIDPNCFSSSQKSTGGRALRHYASIRLELHRVRSIKSAGETIGSRIRATVKKNKVAPPYRFAEFDLLFPSPHVGGIEGGR